MSSRKVGFQTGGIVVAGALATSVVPLESRAQEGANVLDEIVVSARRREESLQQVPLAITAFSGDDLEARGIEEISGLNAMVPNLSVQGGAGREIESSATFRVRGMPGVAVYVDGIDQTSAVGLFTMGVVEVDRIEVLRGPQGTLFGNSALGGAIQYVTRQPNEEFGGRIQATTGSFNRREIQASVDVPLTENFHTKFTMADMSRNGFMTSVDSGRKYGDINDQFYRADLLFTPTDSLSLRYGFDKSVQDRAGGARAVWEIGPTTQFVVGGQVVNNNPHAQAYANAFGIQFNDQQVVSGYPGGAVGEYETRVAHETPGLYLDLSRHTFDINWDINDSMQLRTIAGKRTQERRLMVDFDSDSRVYFADRQDNNEYIEDSLEMQLIGSHGDRNQFSWVFGAFANDRVTKSRFPTISAPTMTCDILSFGAIEKPRRGVTIADEAMCFNNRMRALGLQNQFVATPVMTSAQIASMWTQASAQQPNLNGVTVGTMTSLAANNAEVLDIGYDETSAIFADLNWSITDKLSIALGVRSQDDEHLGTDRILRADLLEAAPWNNLEYRYSDPFGYARVTQRLAASEFSKTTTRFSVQYNWRDDLMTYLTVSDGYGPGGRSVSPTTVLNVVNGVAVGGILRDVYNAGQSDLPFELNRGEQTVDNYEIGIKADWFGRRLRTNLTAFATDWRNMTGSTYVATVWWDTDGNGQADSRIPCAARCTDDGLWEIQYFPNLLTSAVAKAEASGVEVELTWAGGANYQVGANFGLLDTAFVDLGEAGLGTVPAYKVGDKFAGAPDMTANLWGQYDWMLGNGGMLAARLDYTWTDDYTTFAGGPLQRTQKAYGLLNARVTYDPGENWFLTVAGTNLSDEYYSPAFFYTVSQQLWQGSVGRPREVALGLNFRFN
jgi:outer membrane receptor protein involved in Fe transport